METMHLHGVNTTLRYWLIFLALLLTGAGLHSWVMHIAWRNLVTPTSKLGMSLHILFLAMMPFVVARWKGPVVPRVLLGSIWLLYMVRVAEAVYLVITD